MSDILRVNNVIYSWSSHSAKFDGVPYNGILDVKHSQKRERKVVWGMKRNGTPLGKTSGKYSTGGITLKMLADSYDKLTTQMTLKGLGSYGDAEFVFALQLAEPVPGAIPITKIWTGCTIDGEDEGTSEGVDEATVDVEIGALEFTQNGKRLWSATRSLAL